MAMPDPCVACVQHGDSKRKPGIIPCLGCKQMFCTQHIAFHRQELANELDLVISKRNEIQDTLDQRQEIPDVSVKLNLIDEWMKKTIAQVQQVADGAREQVIRQAEAQQTSIKDQFTELSKQIDTLRENENFYEKDIQDLKEKCADLRSLLNLLKIDVKITDISTFLAQAVTFRQEKEKPAETVSFIENLVQFQKPYQSIKIPHTGSIYFGNEVVFIRSGDTSTVIDLKTNSLQSIYISGSSSHILCGSTYLNGILRADPSRGSKIEFHKIEGKNLIKKNETVITVEKVSCMVCFGDRMMVVRYGTNRNNGIEEWSLKDFENGQVQPTNPIHRWLSPLTCTTDENIDNISFNDERIVYIVTAQDRSATRSRVEFRTRNMFVIGQIVLSGYNPDLSSILCPTKDGWLLCDRKKMNSPWHIIFVDNKLKQHEQKILSTYGIINIQSDKIWETVTSNAKQSPSSVVFQRSQLVELVSKKSIVAIYREHGCTDTLTYDRSRLILDLYEI